MKTINIGKDFHKYPGGRYLNDGEGNATAFRDQFLLPILKSGEKAIIVLDSVVGYPASFLEESFGGLVSKCGYHPNEVLDTFTFQSSALGFDFYKNSIIKIVKSTDVGIEKAKEC